MSVHIACESGRKTDLGHTVSLNCLARETDLEDLVDFRSERSCTRRDVLDVSAEQVSDLRRQLDQDTQERRS
jgi:hypothetical protein